MKPATAYERWRAALQHRREAAAARRAVAAARQSLPESDSPESADSDPVAWDVLDSTQEGSHVFALVRRSGPLPWVRVEARVDREEVDGVLIDSLVGRQSLAADRMEVRLKEGADLSAIGTWLTSLGAHIAARSGELEIFDVIWDKPELQTLPQAVPLLASQPEWFAHVQPVTVPFDREMFDFASPEPPVESTKRANQ